MKQLALQVAITDVMQVRKLDSTQFQALICMIIAQQIMTPINTVNVTVDASSMETAATIMEQLAMTASASTSSPALLT